MFEAVNCINDIIVIIEMKHRVILGRINLLHGVNFGFGINLQQSVFQDINLHEPNSLGSSLQLTIYISDAHPVAIHDSQMPDTATHKALRAPTPDAAHAKNYYTLTPDALHSILAQQKGLPIKQRALSFHFQ